MEMTAQRGAIPVTLDKPRVLFFDMPSTALLVERYGPAFVLKLYRPSGTGVELRDAKALAYFTWAGLQAECRAKGEELTEEQVAEFIRPWTITGLFRSMLDALTGAMATPPITPVKPGKAQPAPAKSAARPGKKMTGPGPTKVSTSLQRSVSRSASSPGHRRGSGR